MTINWAVSADDYDLIFKIAKRAERDFAFVNRMNVVMDVTACHANGTPLHLHDLLMAEDYDFAHDIRGITKHINRYTGALEDCFVPRYAVNQ